MIEFALLFGLGFLSAALVALLVAPAIHRRIVRYTEGRLRATLPISPEEVRAQRDMARAVYAAENARVRQELLEQRDRNTALMLREGALSEALKSLEGEKLDLRMQSDRLDADMSDARSLARQHESRAIEFKAELAEKEADLGTRDAEIAELSDRLTGLTANSDTLRIDLSSRDAENESLKQRFANLRDELSGLRDDLRLQTGRAREAETRLSQEQDRAMRLDESLAAAIAENADRAETIARRDQELERLREKLKVATAEAREAGRALRSGKPSARRTSGGAAASAPKASDPGSSETGFAAAEAADTDRLKAFAASAQAADDDLTAAAAALAEGARSRAAALAELLASESQTPTDEAAVREEMAAIAAQLVAVTASREGRSSPIRTILSGKAGQGERTSLAARAKATMEHGSDTRPAEPT